MQSRVFLAVLHFEFFLTGIATTMMGVLLPFVILHWSITDAQAGSLFAAQFVASFLGSITYGELARRIGNKNTVITGLFVIALGVAGLASVAWPLPPTFVAIYGFGLGLALPATNLLVANISPRGRSAALNLLNFFWTLGAVASPLLLVYLLQRYRLSLALVLIGFAAVVAISATLVLLCPAQESAPVELPEAAADSASTPAAIWILTGLLLFLYVGVENGIPGWTPLLGLRQHRLGETSVALALSFYWGALLLGRLAASFLWRTATYRAVISCSLATALLGIVLIAASSSRIALLAGLALCGGGLAAVFPTVVAAFSPRATGRAKGIAGIIFASAGLGGAALPSLVGVLSSHGYSLRLGLWIMAAATALMLLVEQRIAAPASETKAYRPQPRSAEA